MKAEQFIKDYTKRCSNELTDGGYREWLTPDQALKAVEIAIGETVDSTFEEICEWLGDNIVDLLDSYGVGSGDDLNYVNFIDNLRRTRSIVKRNLIYSMADNKS